MWTRLSLVSVQNVQNSVSFNPHLYRKEFVIKILCISLYWKSCNLVSFVTEKGKQWMKPQSSITTPFPIYSVCLKEAFLHLTCIVLKSICMA